MKGPRTVKTPPWRCGNAHEFGLRLEEELPVTAYRAHYGRKWTALPGVLSVSDLRSMCTSGATRHAIRAIDITALLMGLAEAGCHFGADISSATRPTSAS